MRLHLHEYGDPDGEPVVCLHGLTGHGARFCALGRELPGRRLLAPDLRGHGRSGWEPPWDVETHVEDVRETVAAAGVDGGCDWIGYSFGGLLLATLAEQTPEAVRRACLLDPAVHIEPDVCLQWAELERHDEYFSSPDEAIERKLGEGTLFSTPRGMLEEEMRQHLVETDDGKLVMRYCRSAAVAAWSEMARPAPEVAETPTLIVRGEQSWLDVDVERYRAALGDRLVATTVPGGHSLLWDSFEETTENVSRFLAGD